MTFHLVFWGGLLTVGVDVSLTILPALGTLTGMLYQALMWGFVPVLIASCYAESLLGTKRGDLAERRGGEKRPLYSDSICHYHKKMTKKKKNFPWTENSGCVVLFVLIPDIISLQQMSFIAVLTTSGCNIWCAWVTYLATGVNATGTGISFFSHPFRNSTQNLRDGRIFI